MLAPLALTVLLARGGFVVDPYYHHPPSTFIDAVDAATARNSADSRLTPDDDAPQTAPQQPALRAALAFAATAQFDLAAAALVAFASEHPRAAESSWALRRAYLYWHSLGRTHEADQAIHQYESHHAPREPRTAAEFFWSRREHVGGPRRREHLRTYLEHHARHGPPDLRVVAEAELAADLWRASCAHPWHGLCVYFTWATNDAPCSSGRAPLFTVRPRDATSRRTALRHAAAAVRLGRGLDPERVAPWRRPALRTALARAALVTLDDALEQLVALEFPRNLDFHVEAYKNDPGVPHWQQEYREQVRRRDDSSRRFHAYWTPYASRFRAAEHQLHALIDAGSPPELLLGMTRFALVIDEIHEERDFWTSLPESFTRPARVWPPDNWCHNERSLHWFAAANELLITCAKLVPTAGMHPDLSVCFDGFGNLHGAEDWLPEFSPT